MEKQTNTLPPVQPDVKLNEEAWFREFKVSSQYKNKPEPQPSMVYDEKLLFKMIRTKEFKYT